MVAVVDPGHLALASPVAGGKTIDLQAPLRITPRLVVDDPAGLFKGRHLERFLVLRLKAIGSDTRKLS
jgi:hypothetical protein